MSSPSPGKWTNVGLIMFTVRARLILALALCLGIASARAADAPRPNILFILADDLGWRDTSAYGSPFLETPNLERLSDRGRLFTRAYAANPLCSPTRASILTGLDPARIGFTKPAGHLKGVRLNAGLMSQTPAHLPAIQATSITRLDTNYFTLGEVFKEAGYATGHFGKWHLGSEPYSPLQHGFDVDIPHHPGPGPAGSFVAPWKFNPELNFQGEPGEHLEDRMATEAIAWMRENRDKPFFLNYWCFSVHAPFDAKTNYIEEARSKVDPGLPQRSPTYHAMVRSMDDAIGRLLDELDVLGIADNTLVIFFSDNGGNIHSRVDDDVPPTSNAPLRGGKATLFDGGMRVPMIISWPGRVLTNSLTDALFSSVDFYPTLLELLHLDPKPGQYFDGVSQFDSWFRSGAPRREMFSHFPHYTPATGQKPATAMWDDHWKLIRYHSDGAGQSDRFELYTVTTDQGETHNIAGSDPQRVAAMNRKIDEYLERIEAIVPVKNESYRAPTMMPMTDESKLIEETRIYKRIGEKDLSLWWVKPDGWKPTDQRPAVVFFHGGSWTSGTPAQFHPFARHLAQRGMVAFSAQYRLLDKDGGDAPDVCIEDAKSALRYVRALSSEFGIDPGRLGAGGGSAGGHLAATTGLIDGLDSEEEVLQTSSKADVLVLFNPVFNNGPGEWGHGRVGDRYPELSPFHNVTDDAPPTLVMSGSADALISPETMYEFQKRMNTADVRCDIEIYEGAGHGFFNKGRTGDQFFTLTRDRMDAFLVSLDWLAPME